MTVTPYNSDNSKKDQVRDMFDAIAPKYDALNHILSLNIDRGWRRKLVAMVKSHAPASVLDVATGTADLAIMLQKAMPSVSVSGTDLSPEMVEIARHKIAQRKMNIELTVADAEQLPFADASFDAVTAAFGVRNFEDTLAGLRQMCRVVKPGGRVYILEFSVPRPSLFARLYRFYFKRILPAIGRMVSKDARAYTYLPESVEAFAYGENFVTLLHQAGFRNGQYKELMTGVATIYTAQR